MPLRFETDYLDPNIAWEPLVDEVFGELTSSFLELPKGRALLTIPHSKKAIRRLSVTPMRSQN